MPTVESKAFRTTIYTPSKANDKQQAFGPLRAPAGYLLALVSVSLMTLALYGIQIYLKQQDHLPFVRPYSSGYIIPIAVVTALSGRRAGLFALVLSILLSIYILIPPSFSWIVHGHRYWAEIGMLSLVGTFVVLGADGLRSRFSPVQDRCDGPRVRELQERAQQIALAQPEVRGIGECIVHRRGFDYYIHLSLILDDNLTISEGHVITSRVESNIRQSEPLVFHAQVYF